MIRYDQYLAGADKLLRDFCFAAMSDRVN